MHVVPMEMTVDTIRIPAMMARDQLRICPHDFLRSKLTAQSWKAWPTRLERVSLRTGCMVCVISISSIE